MTPIPQLIETIVKHCETRGAAAKLARDLDVSKSTVTRWIEEKSVPESTAKLLRLYFYGEIPFENIRPREDLSEILRFTPGEWNIITILARRVGIEPGTWIAEQVRTIISGRVIADPELQSSCPPSSKWDPLPTLKVADVEAEYKITRKASGEGPK